MFNPFKFYDEMLGIYTNALTGNKDEQEESWVTVAYDVPESLADAVDKLVADFLRSKGYDG